MNIHQQPNLSKKPCLLICTQPDWLIHVQTSVVVHGAETKQLTGSGTAQISQWS